MTSRRRALAVGASALALGLIGPLRARPASLVSTILRVKPAIVGIASHLVPRRPPVALLGSGFAIGDGRHVLTCLHVIAEIGAEDERETIAVLVGAGREVDVRAARLVAGDADHDIAVLAIDGGPLPTLALGDDVLVAEGEEIAFTGFPIGSVLGLYPATHHGIVAARTPIAVPPVDPGRLDAAMIKRLRETDFIVFQLDATAYPGNSGSPLYRADDGQVVGIVASTFVKTTKENVLADPSGITYAVPIRYAKTLMDQAKIRY